MKECGKRAIWYAAKCSSVRPTLTSGEALKPLNRGTPGFGPSRDLPVIPALEPRAWKPRRSLPFL